MSFAQAGCWQVNHTSTQKVEERFFRLVYF